MAISSLLLRYVPVLSLFFSNAAAFYQLQTEYSGASFFDGFNFWSDPDPTNGYVVYNDLTDAQAKNLIDVKDGVAYIYVDSTTSLTVGKDSGRDSIRIQSQEIYNHSLIIADIENMPGGACGTWPAFWTYGPDWPNNGEIDIIEGVNSNGFNQMTLHTAGNCSTTGAFELGTLQNSACTANEGCGVIDYATPLSYGTSFNANKGGVYAMEWTSDWIRVWFFPHGTAPKDIAQGNPDPNGWGEPSSNFQGACTIDDIFHDHTIVFDTTFCGQWAGTAAWDNDPVCGKLGMTCQEYVAGFPQDFAEMYWAINSVKVYQEGSGAPPTTSPPAARTTTPVVVIPPPPSTTPVVVPPPSTSTVAPAVPTTSIPPIISLPTISSAAFQDTTSSSPLGAPTTIVSSISSSTSSVSGGVFAAVSSSSSSSNIETSSSAAPSASSATSQSSTSSAVPSTTSSSAAPSTTSTTSEPSTSSTTSSTTSSLSAASSTSSSTSTTISSTFTSTTSSSSILSNSTSTLAVLSSIVSKQVYSNTSSTFSSTTTSVPVYSNFTSAVTAVASTTSSIVSFSNFSSTLVPTTSTSATSPDPTVVGEFVYFGCYGSTDDFASFGLINESPLMTPELCISECASYVYAGLYGEQCWCGNAFTKSTVADAICDVACPGDATEFCGGEIVTSSRMAKRGAGNVLLTLYTNVYNTPGIGCAGGAACLPSGASSLIASSYSSSITSSSASSTTAFADSAESSLSSSFVSKTSTGDIFFASASSSTFPATSTLTILSTSIYTISSCAATVTDCPYRIGSVTTEIITQYTTFCPGNSASPSSPAVGTSTPVPAQSTLTISPLPASSLPLGTITVSPIPLPTSTAQGEVYTTVIITSYVDICPEGTLSTYSTSKTLTLPVSASSAPSIPFTTTVKSLTIAGSTQIVTLSIPATTSPVSGETGPEGSATISSVLGVKTSAVTAVTAISVPTSSMLYHAGTSTTVKGGVSSTGGVSVPSYSVVPASGAVRVVTGWSVAAGAMAVFFLLL